MLRAVRHGTTTMLFTAKPEGALRSDMINIEHLPRLFDRLLHTRVSRCELEKPHHGQGLFVLFAIARMHDGFPAAKPGGGTTRVGSSP